MKIEEYEAAAEAILFAMGDSVEIKKLAFALQVNEREAEMILRNLADRYQADNCGLQILELDGAYQICTKPSQYEYLIRIAKQPRKQVLTDVLLECISQKYAADGIIGYGSGCLEYAVARLLLRRCMCFCQEGYVCQKQNKENYFFHALPACFDG